MYEGDEKQKKWMSFLSVLLAGVILGVDDDDNDDDRDGDRDDSVI